MGSLLRPPFKPKEAQPRSNSGLPHPLAPLRSANLLCQAACVRVAAVRTSSPQVGAADVGPLIPDPLGAPARTYDAALRLLVCGCFLAHPAF